MTEITDVLDPQKLIKTGYGEITIQDWILDEINRIRSYGRDIRLVEKEGKIQLFLVKPGKGFEKSKWPFCREARECYKSENNKIREGQKDAA